MGSALRIQRDGHALRVARRTARTRRKSTAAADGSTSTAAPSPSAKSTSPRHEFEPGQDRDGWRRDVRSVHPRRHWNRGYPIHRLVGPGRIPGSWFRHSQLHHQQRRGPRRCLNPSAVIGTGGFTKAGAGTMQLAGTNTYSGGTTLSSGTLIVTKDSNLRRGAGQRSGGEHHARRRHAEDRLGAEQSQSHERRQRIHQLPDGELRRGGADACRASANVLGKISSIHVTAGGNTLYTGTAKVVIVGGGGTGAMATATMSGGNVTGITITNQGSGYTSVPTVYITDGSGQGVAGSGAAAVVNGITLTGHRAQQPRL